MRTCSRIVFQAFVVLCVCSGWVLANYSFDPRSYEAQDVITTDVAVVGGGSAGMYTAVRLQDYNKSTLIIEKNDYLGGHARTYVDPQSGVAINLGVIVFPQTQIVRDYFARFDVPLVPLSLSYPGYTFIDFSTGQAVEYVAPAASDVAAAFEGYGAQLRKYPALQAAFNLAYPVAPDLLLPFGTFLDKYNLSALIYTSFLVNQGYSPLPNISTIYMLKYLNANELNSFAKGSLTTASRNTGDFYDRIRAHFGRDVLLNTTILAMDRSSPSNVKIVVQTNKSSSHKLIIANKLLSTPPPKIDQLAGYDLSADEKELFAQFFDNGYYIGVLNNTGLPANTSYAAIGPNQP